MTPTTEFVPVPPAGFDIAGTFDGVTTAFGQGGAPRIRYQVTRTKRRSGGIAGAAKRGPGGEVVLDGLHARLSFAMTALGEQPEAGAVERPDGCKAGGFALGRYLEHSSKAARYGGMALVEGRPGVVELLVTACETEAEARHLVEAAMSPFI